MNSGIFFVIGTGYGLISYPCFYYMYHKVLGDIAQEYTFILNTVCAFLSVAITGLLLMIALSLLLT